MTGPAPGSDHDPTLSVRKATAADLAAARALLEQYPHKREQQAAQRLDRGRLLDFFMRDLEAGLEGSAPHWIAEEGGEPVALAGLAPDHWHGEVYGLKMGHVRPWVNTVNPQNGAPLLDQALAEARRQDYQHLSVRVDGADFRNLHLMEAHGFRLIDVSLKFSRPLPLGAANIAEPPLAQTNGLRVGIAEPNDRQWIRTLGSRTHGATHYLNDPDLPRDKTRELFARWLDRCIERLAYRIYTLKDADGRGLGFVTYLRNRAFAEALGRAPLILDFILLDPELRGQGVGPWFMEQTLPRESDQEFDYCELRTSAHNPSAVACYEKLGFCLCASDFVLSIGRSSLFNSKDHHSHG